MSKRTTSSKPTPEVPTPRRRAAKPADNATAAPKTPRTRRKTSIPEVAAAADTITPPVSTRTPSHDEIAIRAYFISLEQGADPVAAWLLAERELTTA